MEQSSPKIELAKIAEDALSQVPSMLAELEGRSLEEGADSHWPTRFISVGIKEASVRWSMRFVASGFKRASQRI